MKLSIKPTSLFLFIDFQKIFKEGPEWKVPKFDSALQNALRVHAHLQKELGDDLTTITTKYIPPPNPKGSHVLESLTPAMLLVILHLLMTGPLLASHRIAPPLEA